MANGGGRVKARGAYVLREVTDKAGRKYKRPDEIVVSQGMYSARDAERMAMDAADEVGASYDDIRVDAYEQGESPMGAVFADEPADGDSFVMGDTASGWPGDGTRTFAARKARGEWGQPPPESR